MALEGRDLGDSQILQQTVQESNEKGLVRMKTTLPSGRDLVSEWMNSDDAKKVVMSWCQNVRQQIDFDAQEAKAAKQREKDLADVVQEETKEQAVEEVTDPITYATHQRDMYIARAEVLEERLESTEIELKKVREHLEQWNVIVHKLRGETDE